MYETMPLPNANHTCAVSPNELIESISLFGTQEVSEPEDFSEMADTDESTELSDIVCVFASSTSFFDAARFVSTISTGIEEPPSTLRIIFHFQ